MTIANFTLMWAFNASGGHIPNRAEDLGSTMIGRLLAVLEETERSVRKARRAPDPAISPATRR